MCADRAGIFSRRMVAGIRPTDAHAHAVDDQLRRRPNAGDRRVSHAAALDRRDGIDRSIGLLDDGGDADDVSSDSDVSFSSA